MSRRTRVVLALVLAASFTFPAVAAEDGPRADGLLARVQAVWSFVFTKIGGGLEPLGEANSGEPASRIGTTAEPGGEANLEGENVDNPSRIGSGLEPLG